MNERPSSKLGPFGRYIVYSGASLSFVLVFIFFVMRPLEGYLGERPLPYLIFGIVIAATAVDRFFYRRLSQRTILLVGIIGWLFTFLLLLAWGLFFS